MWWLLGQEEAEEEVSKEGILGKSPGEIVQFPWPGSSKLCKQEVEKVGEKGSG